MRDFAKPSVYNGFAVTCCDRNDLAFAAFRWRCGRLSALADFFGAMTLEMTLDSVDGAGHRPRNSGATATADILTDGFSVEQGALLLLGIRRCSRLRIWQQPELLHHSESIADLRAATGQWLQIYNSERPHDSLVRVPPLTFLPRPTTAGESPIEPSA